MAQYTLAVSDEEVERYRMMAATAAEQERPLWELAGIAPGAVVADVGCGPAATAVELAKAVGPSGRVLGIERDAAALKTAHRLVEAAGARNVELRDSAADATGLPEQSVDVAMLRHVLAHNGGREQAIVDHLAGRVRPGGSVYLVDVDLTAIRLLDAESELVEMQERYVAFHRQLGNDPLIGLRLGQLLAAAGLELLAHEGRYTILQPPPGLRPPSWAAREAMVAAGVATADDLARWEAAFARADAGTPRTTLFAPTFVAVGRQH